MGENVEQTNQHSLLASSSLAAFDVLYFWHSVDFLSHFLPPHFAQSAGERGALAELRNLARSFLDFKMKRGFTQLANLLQTKVALGFRWKTLPLYCRVPTLKPFRHHTHRTLCPSPIQLADL